VRTEVRRGWPSASEIGWRAGARSRRRAASPAKPAAASAAGSRRRAAQLERPTRAPSGSPTKGVQSRRGWPAASARCRWRRRCCWVGPGRSVCLGRVGLFGPGRVVGWRMVGYAFGGGGAAELAEISRPRCCRTRGNLPAEVLPNSRKSLGRGAADCQLLPTASVRADRTPCPVADDGQALAVCWSYGWVPMTGHLAC